MQRYGENLTYQIICSTFFVNRWKKMILVRKGFRYLLSVICYLLHLLPTHKCVHTLKTLGLRVFLGIFRQQITDNK